MIISEFTKPELDFLRETCNFVGSEKPLFEMRSRGVSLEEIADTLNMSVEGIKKVSRKVNSKISRVL